MEFGVLFYYSLVTAKKWIQNSCELEILHVGKYSSSLSEFSLLILFILLPFFAVTFATRGFVVCLTLSLSSDSMSSFIPLINPVSCKRD